MLSLGNTAKQPDPFQNNISTAEAPMDTDKNKKDHEKEEDFDSKPDPELAEFKKQHQEIQDSLATKDTTLFREGDGG
jgi:hypothetical protein